MMRSIRTNSFHQTKGVIHAEVLVSCHRGKRRSPRPQALVAQNQTDIDQQLGSVHFQTSCNDVAQRRFDRGMRYQHSYWYSNAKDVFEEAIKADPRAAWPIGASPSPTWTIRTTRSLSQIWRRVLPRSPRPRKWEPRLPRERDYIDALMVMYADYDKILTPNACVRCVMPRR